MVTKKSCSKSALCFYRPGLVNFKHVIQVEKDMFGKIRFYDPQSGKILKTNKTLYDAYACLRMGLNNVHFSPIIFRIDDKEFDMNLLNGIFKKD